MNLTPRNLFSCEDEGRIAPFWETPFPSWETPLPVGSPPSQVGKPLSPVGRPPSPVGRPPSPVGRPPSPVGRPLSQVGRPPSLVGRPLSQVGRPPSQVGRPLSQVGRPPSQVGRPPSQVGRPPSPVGRPPSLVGRPPSQLGKGVYLSGRLISPPFRPRSQESLAQRTLFPSWETLGPQRMRGTWAETLSRDEPIPLAGVNYSCAAATIRTVQPSSLLPSPSRGPVGCGIPHVVGDPRLAGCLFYTTMALLVSCPEGAKACSQGLALLASPW